MRKLGTFTFITLDGYFEGPEKGQYAWHKPPTEQGEGNMQFDSILLFGRLTYEHMVRFWPTAEASKMFPEMARNMNNAEKIVFSNSLIKSDWNNTRIIKGNIVEEIRNLKNTPGKDMRILGSGSIVTQFAESGLIDEFQLMLDPVAIGNGTSIFKNINRQLNLELVSSQAFKDGVLLLTYKPK